MTFGEKIFLGLVVTCLGACIAASVAVVITNGRDTVACTKAGGQLVRLQGGSHVCAKLEVLQ